MKKKPDLVELAVLLANAMWPVRDQPLTFMAGAALKVLEKHAKGA